MIPREPAVDLVHETGCYLTFGNTSAIEPTMPAALSPTTMRTPRSPRDFSQDGKPRINAHALSSGFRPPAPAWLAQRNAIGREVQDSEGRLGIGQRGEQRWLGHAKSQRYDCGNGRNHQQHASD